MSMLLYAASNSSTLFSQMLDPFQDFVNFVASGAALVFQDESCAQIRISCDPSRSRARVTESVFEAVEYFSKKLVARFCNLSTF